MIKAFKALFEPANLADEKTVAQQTNLAAAALLIETARADFIQDGDEEAALSVLLRDVLKIDQAQVDALMKEASQKVDEATSLYEFTRQINDHYSPDQKIQVIEAMWQVAYADGNLDKYEEHLIRQVADLTYVPHADYIRCKLNARPAD